MKFADHEKRSNSGVRDAIDQVRLEQARQQVTLGHLENQVSKLDAKVNSLESKFDAAVRELRVKLATVPEKILAKMEASRAARFNSRVQFVVALGTATAAGFAGTSLWLSRQHRDQGASPEATPSVTKLPDTSGLQPPSVSQKR